LPIRVPVGGSIWMAAEQPKFASHRREPLEKKLSRWIHEQAFIRRAFAWQRGYSAFSVSESRMQEVISYMNKRHITDG
jgi:hypothetical protein